MRESRHHTNLWADKLSQVSLPDGDEAWKGMQLLLDKEMPVRPDRRRWLLLILLLLLLIGVCNCPGRLGTGVTRQEDPKMRGGARVVGGGDRVDGDSHRMVGGGDRVDGDSDRMVGGGDRVDGDSGRMVVGGDRGAGDGNRMVGGGDRVVGDGDRDKGSAAGVGDGDKGGGGSVTRIGNGDKEIGRSVARVGGEDKGTGGPVARIGRGDKGDEGAPAAERERGRTPAGGAGAHGKKRGKETRIPVAEGKQQAGQKDGQLVEKEDTAGADGAKVVVKAFGKKDADTLRGKKDAVAPGGKKDADTLRGKKDAVAPVGKKHADSLVGKKHADSLVGKKGVVSPENPQKNTRGWTVGIGLNQFFTIGGQQASHYNSGGISGTLGDYIPVPMVRYHFNRKFFIQLEAQFNSPQYTGKSLLISLPPLDSLSPAVRRQSSVFIKKLFYFNVPLSLHYRAARGLDVGAGIQFSRLSNGIGLFQDRTYAIGGGPGTDSVAATSKSFKGDTLYKKIRTNELRALLDASYMRGRFIFGVRYNQALSQFIHIQVAPGQITQARNSQLQIYLRYVLWDNQKAPQYPTK